MNKMWGIFFHEIEKEECRCEKNSDLSALVSWPLHVLRHQELEVGAVSIRKRYNEYQVFGENPGS